MTTWTIEETKKNIFELHNECLSLSSRLEKVTCFEEDPKLFGDILIFADKAQPIVEKVTRTSSYRSSDSLFTSMAKFNNKKHLSVKGAKAIAVLYNTFVNNYSSGMYPERELTFGIPDPLW